MLFIFACHSPELYSDTAALEDDDSSVPVVVPSEDPPDGSYPSLQWPLDGTVVEDGPVEFGVLSSSPVAISIFLQDDLTAPIFVSETLDAVDGMVDWSWAAAEPWQTYNWYAENETGTSVMWQFDKRGQNDPPLMPELVSPEADAVVVESELQFHVAGSSDPDGDDFRYTIQLFKDGQEHSQSPLLSEDELPWTPDLYIESMTSFCWTAWAVDDKEDEGLKAEPICFELHPD